MAHFDDLHSCTYFGGDATHLLAVGWLEQGRPFPRGKCPSDFIARLEELLESPWAPVAFAGPHFCDLCPGRTAAGSGNLFVPDEAAVFVAPELISHYIEAHDYRPPDAFISAVMRCPVMNSEAYTAAVRRHYRFEVPGGAGTGRR